MVHWFFMLLFRRASCLSDLWNFFLYAARHKFIQVAHCTPSGFSIILCIIGPTQICSRLNGISVLKSLVKFKKSTKIRQGQNPIYFESMSLVRDCPEAVRINLSKGVSIVWYMGSRISIAFIILIVKKKKKKHLNGMMMVRGFVREILRRKLWTPFFFFFHPSGSQCRREAPRLDC